MVEFVRYQGQIAAIVSRQGVALAAHIDALEDDHADRRFVLWMCMYARDVLLGELPGPYADDQAQLFARCCLLPDTEFQQAASEPDALLADRFNVPVAQIASKRTDLRGQQSGPAGSFTP